MLWFRWVTIGLFVAISGGPALAAQDAQHRSPTEPHRRTAKTPKNPALHAKVMPKKKRPTVPHQKRRVAKQHKANARSRHARNGNRSLPKAHKLADTQSHKATLESETRNAKRAEPEKPRHLGARDEVHPAREVTPPTPPKEPDAPKVKSPKEPSAIIPQPKTP